MGTPLLKMPEIRPGLWISNCCRVLAISTLITTSAQAFGEDSLATLVESLNARSLAIRTFQADVKLVIGPGDGLGPYRIARKNWATWLKSHGHAALAAKELSDLQDKERYESLSTEYRYHYAVDAGKSIRIDELGMSAGRTIASVYSDGRWATLDTGSRPESQMTIYREMMRLPSATNMEVARGAGVPVSPELMLNGISATSVFSDSISWAEFGKEVVACKNIKAPDAQRMPGPIYQAATKLFSSDLWPKLNMPLCIFDIALDSSANLAPVYLKCTNLVPHNGAPSQYITDAIIEWSSPEFSQDGTVIYKNCRIGAFGRVASPSPSFAKDEDFPYESFELQVQQIEFSNIKVNNPIDESVFRLIAPQGANVIDQVAGERYIVGSAGEALQRTALQARSKRVAPQLPSATTSGRKALVVANVVVFIVLFSFWLYRRRSATL